VSTDVDKFVPKKKVRKPSGSGEAAHQGHVPEAPPPPQREAEHQGRVPQPGVPEGPRNTPVKVTVRKGEPTRKVHARGLTNKVPTKAPTPTTLPAPAKAVAKFVTDEAKNAAEVALSKVEHPASTAKQLSQVAFPVPATAARILAGETAAPSDKELKLDAWALPGIGFGPDAAKVAQTTGATQVAEHAAHAALSQLGKKGASKVVAKVKGAPRAAAKAPAKKVRAIKSAPRRAKETVKRAPELKTAQGRHAAEKQVGKTVVHHPLKTGVPAAAVIPTGTIPGDPGKRVRAAAEGSAAAIWNHPVETFKTTARALPAAITGPVALGAAGVDSVLKGTPAPLINTAKEEAKGVEQIVGKTFSGNAKEAELAARKEGSLSLLTPLPAVTRLKPYARGRTAARAASGAVRRKIAGKSDTLNRKVRHSPKGVEEPVFAITARHAQRKKTAKTKQRADNPARVANAKYDSDITHALAKAPRGSHVALQTVAEYGVRDKHGADLLRQRGPGDKGLLKALDYMDRHPELFSSDAFHRAVAAVKADSENAPAFHAGKGRRARLMPHGDLFGIARPEERIPFNQRDVYDGATTWAEAVKKLDAMKQNHLGPLREAKKQEQLAKAARDRTRKVKSRNTGRVKRATAERPGAKRIKGTAALARTDKAHYEAVAAYKAAKANLRSVKADRQHLQALRDTAKKNDERSHTEAGAQKYDNRMLDEYQHEVEAARSGTTLAPSIFTHHLESGSDRGAGFQQRFTTSGANKEYMRKGTSAAEDNLDRSLPGLLQGYNSSRLRGAGRQSMRNIAKDNMKSFEIDGKVKNVIPDNQTWRKITGPKTKENPDGGQYDPNHYARLALRAWKRAVEDPYMSGVDRNAALEKVLKDAETDNVKNHEPSILVPREVVKELEAQLNPNHNRVMTTLNTSSRIATRTLLGTNPAWALAQTVAEGVPLLLAHPELALDPTKLYRIQKDLHAYRKQNPEGALALQSTAGASPVGAAALRTPLDEQERYTPDEWAKGADALTRGKGARYAISFAKLRTLGEFDVRRQNAYRQALFAAEADKRFRNFHRSLTHVFDDQRALSTKFKGKSRQEMWDWLNNDPKGRIEQQKLADYVDNIQGDWTSFTSHERALAPLVLFYPFLRYSLRWTLWTFPKTHPVTATIAYMLGQANSNQLESLLGKTAYEEGMQATDAPMTPGNPLAWALPIYTNEKGEKGVLPGGSRISPGQSALTQAAATGNWAQVLSSSNPLIGAAITGFTGTEPLTGEQSSLPKGIAMLNQLFSMPSFDRVKLPGFVPGVGGRTLQHAATEGLSGKPQSALSKKFESYDPNKNLRSVALPGIPLAGTKWADSELLGKAVDQKFSDPIPGLSPEVTTAIYGTNGKGGWIHGEKAPLLALVKQHKLSKKEGELVTEAEKPYFGAEAGLTKKQQERVSEAYEIAQGGILIPSESRAEKRAAEEKRNPFGLANGGESFNEKYGIGTASGETFKEKYGIR